MDREEIKRALTSILGSEYLDSNVDAILYGSRMAQRDIDLVLVQPTAPATPQFVVGQLDCFVCGRSDFDQLALLFDPAATEPLLTGELLLGDRERISSLRERVVGMTSNSERVHHLSRRSLQEYVSADRLWAEARVRGSKAMLGCSLQNLSYSSGYAAFASHYSSDNRRATTLAQLREQGELPLPQFWAWRTSIKEGQQLEPSELAAWLDRWARSVAVSGTS